ncbi:MAG: UDP-N-acetylglucosamine 1-carboxyvinyltransferase, partial [Marinosulfonomonas sp.]
MDSILVKGGAELNGEIPIAGAKNACLTLMPATLLSDEPLTLTNVPRLSDIATMTQLLQSLGVEVTSLQDGRVVAMSSQSADNPVADYDIVRKMRASNLVLGPLIARHGHAVVSMPGGCNIGDRPVDLHLRGLEALGAHIHLDEGYIVASLPKGKRLEGARIFLGGPFGSTVLGTANVMSAAVLAKGQTVIESAACEPEIQGLADMLIAMGAKITGAGSPRIIIDGVDSLGGVDYTVMPDRIEAGTYIMAGAITNGDVILENCPVDALSAVIDRLKFIGVELEPIDETDPLRQTVRVASARRLAPVQLTTQPHPGFPTDLQAQIMALLCLADGNSIITEKIFPDRFLHVAELLRMGANLTRNGSSVLVTGVRVLIGAPVMASDLRASAGLVLAGLAARGTTTINRVYHLDR